MADATARYLRALTRGEGAARVATRVLAAALPPSMPRRDRRRAAAGAVAAAAALLPCALARHGVRRGNDPEATWAVARKFGRPEDLDAPDIGVRAQLDGPRLDPRLGGLLGDSSDSISAWLASGSRASAADLGRSIAAVAPLVLGALTRTTESAAGLASALVGFSPEALDHPGELETGRTPPARVFREIRRRVLRSRGLSWLLGRRRP